MSLGEFDNRASTRVEHIRTALERVKVTVSVPANCQARLWEKFVLVTALGGVGAVDAGGAVMSAVIRGIG